MTDWSVIVNILANEPISHRRYCRASLTVIASEATQSISPPKERMDCFHLRQGFGGQVASLATAVVLLHTMPSSPAKAGDPVPRGFSVRSSASLEYWVTRLRG